MEYKVASTNMGMGLWTVEAVPSTDYAKFVQRHRCGAGSGDDSEKPSSRFPFSGSVDRSKKARKFKMN